MTLADNLDRFQILHKVEFWPDWTIYLGVTCPLVTFNDIFDLVRRIFCLVLVGSKLMKWETGSHCTVYCGVTCPWLLARWVTDERSLPVGLFVIYPTVRIRVCRIRFVSCDENQGQPTLVCTKCLVSLKEVDFMQKYSLENYKTSSRLQIMCCQGTRLHSFNYKCLQKIRYNNQDGYIIFRPIGYFLGGLRKYKVCGA